MNCVTSARPFQETLIAQGGERPVLWLKVNTPQGMPVWLGLSDPALLPNVSCRNPHGGRLERAAGRRARCRSSGTTDATRCA